MKEGMVGQVGVSAGWGLCMVCVVGPNPKRSAPVLS